MVAVVLLLAGRAHGAVFNYISPPVDVTPAAGAWNDVNVSAYVPVGTTGVIIQMYNPTGSGYHFGVRNNTSSDTWMLAGTGKTALAGASGFFTVGVDGSRIFDCYVENTACKAYLVGYTNTGVTFFTNGVNKSLGSGGGTWTDINISGDTGANTAIGAIFIVKNVSATADNYGLRKKGSSDTRYQGLMAGHATGAIIGVDSAEICQMAIFDTNVDAYLVGYVTKGAVFHTNSTLYAVTTGAYRDADITPSIGGDDANGAIVEFFGASGYSTGIRANGQTYDYYGFMQHEWAVTAIDSNDIFEQQISNNNQDCYLVGYTLDTTTNYRSVGTNAATLYSTGNATINIDSSTVTFAGGASLPSNVGQGDKLTIGATVFYIRTKDSSTQVTVHETATATLTNQAYTIARAYNTFASWETARQGNLVSDNRVEAAVAYNDGDFVPGAVITINGSTTDATRYMMITVAPGHRHAGIGGAGVVLDGNNSGSYHGIQINDDYTRVEWLQFTRYGGAAGRAAVKIDASNVLLDKLIAYNFNTGHTNKALRCTSGTVTMRNCLVYDGSDNGIRAAGGTITAQNCTVYGMTAGGVVRGSGTLNATNTISMGNGGSSFTSLSSQSYNMSSDATATGAGSLTNKVAANQFVNISSGSYDFHLKSGSDAINVGSDLSGSFNADLEGETRPAGSAWDIGADERAAGSTETNYRSVGTNAGTIYSTGTCSVSGGSTTVTFGGGASLPGNVGQGDKLTVGSNVFYLYSRDSATQATVQVAASSTLSNQAYTITRAYNDFGSWESARQGNLVSDNRQETAVAYDDGDFTSAVIIDGSTTDATHYMAITVASGQRHAGQAGVGAVLDMNSTATGITVNDDYTQISWLQIRRTGANNSSGVMVQSASNVLLDSLLIHDFNDSGNAYGINGSWISTVMVRNCMIFDGSGAGIIATIFSSNLTVQNCTIYGITGRGIYKPFGTITATNTIVMGCTIEDFWPGVTQSYNMSMDATASGTGSLPGSNPANQFVSITPGSFNLHLKSGSTALDAGTDLSGSFTYDIDGAARPIGLAWDMGADEAAPSPTRRITSWREVSPN